jgi:multidrug efflux pump
MSPSASRGGLTGALFRELAFTLAGAVFISGVVALTLSPMMASKLVRVSERPGRMVRAIDRTFEAVKRAYARLLARTLGARPAVYTVWVVLGLMVVPMYAFSPVELAPQEDQGVVFGAIEVPANATLEQLTPCTEQVEQTFETVPEFDQSFQVTFPGGGFGGALMTPWDARARSIFPIQEELADKLTRVAGIRAPAFLPSALPSAGFLPVELVIASTAGHEERVAFAQQIVLAALESGQFAFPPSTDVKIDQAKSEIVVDRDKAASMGVSMQQLGSDLASMLGANFVNRFEMDGRSYKVMAVRATVEPRTLNRFQQLNAVKISGVAPRSTEAGLRVLEDAAARILPAGYRVDYTGESRQLRQEAGKFLPAMLLALALIFLVLAAQFDSFRDPFVILAGSVPLAMFGALAFTFLKFTGPPACTSGSQRGGRRPSTSTRRSAS